uniref:Ionotropic receptor 8a n=1 Tax=Aulacocentrum confusum TaxID=2767324 RepID=A0A7G8Z9I4_9HYME|nr:ionotropic receptor 8a [Aulacocentrum confusum]
MQASSWPLHTLIFVMILRAVQPQTTVKMMILIEMGENNILEIISDALAMAERSLSGDQSVKIDIVPVVVDRDSVDESYNHVCSELFSGVTLILDMTYTGWDRVYEIARNHSIMHVRSAAKITPYIQASNDLLMRKSATDVALIFQSEKELNQSLYRLIGESTIRLVVIDELSDITVTRIRAMRPSPSYYMIYASTDSMEGLFNAALRGNLVSRNDTWYLVFTDMNYRNFRYFQADVLDVNIGVLSMNSVVCCRLLRLDTSCTCPTDTQIYEKFIERMIFAILEALDRLQKSNTDLEPRKFSCSSPNENIPTPEENESSTSFYKILVEILTSNNALEFISESSEGPYHMPMIIYEPIINIEILKNGNLEDLATWRRDGIQTAPGKEILPVKHFFRIGTATALPWSMIKTDSTGAPMRDEKGNLMWEGYCIDFIQKLAEKMKFDYEIVNPKDNLFGEKLENGKWNGLIGDLTSGETDMAIGALTMTSEREEVIDFVAPYFEQSGILIVLRKPVRKSSLFKFMTVLRLEVWLSIVGALTLTAIMIWVLDKYSPYSARNNKKIYPYPCREFTLKESFWFALTSFTPQGGGEAPKALSSRTLVAAYWLFVVLMLATFTANLAAFLTVERMQAQVQSLEQLARQSRINYTVVNMSSSHQYFVNMRSAEDKIYKMWKEITLNSSSDQVEYRVWDYPIKEQYGHILQTMLTVGLVNDTQEGFRKVEENENSEFAFIHDSAEIKYEVTKNCNLTEIGEVFAEQPYAVAVQQGSHLQEEISRTILELQKDRYFEGLTAKWWNSSMKCSTADDNEGITLESLGGVFIATLFGLALAMVTLAGEVIYYRRRNAIQSEKAKDTSQEKVSSGPKIMTRINSKSKLRQLKPSPPVSFIGRHRGLRPRISHISVYPKTFPFKE